MRWNWKKIFRNLRGWAYGGALGAFLAVAGGASAQTPPAPLAAPAVIAEGPAGVAKPAPAPAVIDKGTVVDTPLAGSVDGSFAEPPSIWAKVPPPFQYTKIGGIFVLPTGPGYYSACDLVKGNYRENPPVFPVPPFGLIPPVPFFDANYRYLDKPDNNQTDWDDFTKRIHIGDNWMFSFGGEERIRYNNEVDSRLTGKDNQFDSFRSRVYTDLWYKDVFRVYAEFQDATVHNEKLPPSGTDIDKSDILNLFIDAKVLELGGNGAYVRVGRQELYYGSQRLVSPTDFPNAVRTFDGVKGFWHSDALDVDAFLTRPVVINPSRFDSENDKAAFAGLWGTYKPAKGQYVDLYYLYLDNDAPLSAKPVKGRRGGFDCDTVGSRYTGDYKFFLWDFEGMYQFGDHANQTISAGAGDAGVGTHFADVPGNPTLWVYFDYASGSSNPGKGQYSTFNQLFPNGHAYFGGTDLVGRQNIQDLNVDGWFNPVKWIIVGAQYHVLELDSAKDALYNAAGAVERSSPTGKAGRDVGQVVTMYTNFHLSMHSDVLIQYSHLEAGEFIQRTGPGGSPSELYLQYSFRW